MAVCKGKVLKRTECAPGGLNCSIRVRTAVRCCPEVEFEVGGRFATGKGFSSSWGSSSKSFEIKSGRNCIFSFPGEAVRVRGREVFQLPTGEGGGSVRVRIRIRFRHRDVLLFPESV